MKRKGQTMKHALTHIITLLLAPLASITVGAFAGDLSNTAVVNGNGRAITRDNVALLVRSETYRSLSSEIARYLVGVFIRNAEIQCLEQNEQNRFTAIGRRLSN
jgi:hypothetical protein